MSQYILLFFLLLTFSFAEGTRESDSLALIAIRDANPNFRLHKIHSRASGGPTTPVLWHEDTTFADWKGVKLDSSGRVIGLALQNVEIDTIPEVIGILTELISLNLYGNPISSLPDDIKQLQKLKTLEVSSPKLVAFPKVICLLTSLELLSYNSSSTPSLPPEIGNLKNLTTLELNDNSFSSVPAEIANLKNLNSLKLEGNSFSTIPLGILELTELTSLDMEDNIITSIPSEIARMVNLSSLELRENNLSELPPSIGKLTSLRTLGINNNKLKSLPSEIGFLTNLTRLSLNHNQLTTLPASVGLLKNLRGLYLEHNNLTNFPNEITSLRDIILSVAHNHLLPQNLTYEVITWLDSEDYNWDNYQTYANNHTASLHFNYNTVFAIGNQWEYEVYSGNSISDNTQTATIKITVNDKIESNDTLLYIFQRNEIYPNNATVSTFDTLYVHNDKALIPQTDGISIYHPYRYESYRSSFAYDLWYLDILLCAESYAKTESPYQDSITQMSNEDITKQDYMYRYGSSGITWSTFVSTLYAKDIGIISRRAYGTFRKQTVPDFDSLWHYIDTDYITNITLASFNGNSTFTGKEILTPDYYSVGNKPSHYSFKKLDNLPKISRSEYGITITNAKEVKSVKIFDLKGRLLKSEISHFQDIITINTTSLASGIFFVSYTTDNHSRNFKFIH